MGSGKGELEEDKGGGELPCVVQVCRGENLEATALGCNHDGAIGEGSVEVEAATLEEVLGEGMEDCLQGAGFLPEAVTAVAGLVGGVATGEVGPRGGTANLPQDGIQDGAGIELRPAACRGIGRRWRMAFGDDGLDQGPLLVGEVHGVITIRSFSGEKTKELRE